MSQSELGLAAAPGQQSRRWQLRHNDQGCRDEGKATKRKGEGKSEQSEHEGEEKKIHRETNVIKI